MFRSWKASWRSGDSSSGSTSGYAARTNRCSRCNVSGERTALGFGRWRWVNAFKLGQIRTRLSPYCGETFCLIDGMNTFALVMAIIDFCVVSVPQMKCMPCATGRCTRDEERSHAHPLTPPHHWPARKHSLITAGKWFVVGYRGSEP